MVDVNKVKERLLSFGYEAGMEDDSILAFCIEKVENGIKANLNRPEVPEGLRCVCIDMVCGEFLQLKRSFSPENFSEILDLGAAVKQIQTGDTNTVFDTEGSMTDDQRLDAFIGYLKNHGKDEFNSYRCIRW